MTKKQNVKSQENRYLTQTIPVNQTLDTYDFGGMNRKVLKVDKSMELYPSYKSGSGVLNIKNKPEVSRNQLNEHPVI